MDSISLFMTHLNSFLNSHGLSREVPERIKKCQEEDQELAYAVTDEEKRGEAVDRLITALALLQSLGVNNPLWAAYVKLLEVSNREDYRKMREGSHE